MGIRTIIPGPPGTGKTFRLVNHYLEKEINEYKTDPQKIIYITYSNAGVNEAAKRIKYDLLYIKTMHSVGTKELKINTSKLLLNGKRKSKPCKDCNAEGTLLGENHAKAWRKLYNI